MIIDVEILSSAGKVYTFHDMQTRMTRKCIDLGDSFYDLYDLKVFNKSKESMVFYGNRLYSEEEINKFKKIRDLYSLDDTSFKNFSNLLSFYTLPYRGIRGFNASEKVYLDDSFGDIYLINQNLYLSLSNNEVLNIKLDELEVKGSMIVQSTPISLSSLQDLDYQRIIKSLKVLKVIYNLSDENKIKIDKLIEEILLTKEKSKKIVEKEKERQKSIKEQREKEKEIEKESKKIIIKGDSIQSSIFIIKIKDITGLEFNDDIISINSYGHLYKIKENYEFFLKVKNLYLKEEL